MFTRFFDMYSGGERKEDFDCCFIEAPLKEAIEIFKTRFNRDPENVTCECCGLDYSIYEVPSYEPSEGVLIKL